MGCSDLTLFVWVFLEVPTYTTRIHKLVRPHILRAFIAEDKTLQQLSAPKAGDWVAALSTASSMPGRSNHAAVVRLGFLRCRPLRKGLAGFCAPREPNTP